MARLLRFAVAAATAIAMVLLLTFGTYSLHLWVGGHIFLRDFLARSCVLLPFILGLVAGLYPSPKLNRSPSIAVITGAVVGFVYGYLTPRLAESVHFRRAFGHWPRLGASWMGFGNMGWDLEVAALVCGISAGICAMLFSITARNRLVILGAVILVLIAVLVPAPSYDLVTHNQELTVAVMTPYSDAAITKKPDVTADVYSTPVDVARVNDQVLSLLRGEGIREQYVVSTLYRGGHGKQALAVIVLNHPVANNVELGQPRGGNVIYLQQPNGWKRIPPQSPALERFLSLEPPVVEGAFAGLMVHGVGLTTGFEVF